MGGQRVATLQRIGRSRINQAMTLVVTTLAQRSVAARWTIASPWSAWWRMDGGNERLGGWAGWVVGEWMDAWVGAWVGRWVGGQVSGWLGG